MSVRGLRRPELGTSSATTIPAAPIVFAQRANAVMQEQEEGGTVRIWVPGCATGEEAYSVAITVLETSEALEKFFEFKIFATDINNDAIATARRGCFPESIAADVSIERLKQFFTKQDDHYHVDRKIRDLIIFAVHDISRDPPFTGSPSVLKR